MVIATVIFAIYASTAAPTIVGGDAGELVLMEAIFFLFLFYSTMWFWVYK